MRDARAVEPLIELLLDAEEAVRKNAAALREIGDTRAIEALTQALNHRDINLRNVATQALDKIKEKGSSISHNGT